MSTLYLMHHGIKGQKWGVRNGPPYPIEDKVLKKGTRLSNVAYAQNTQKYLDSRNGQWVYTYNTNDEWDSKVYEGPFTYYLYKRADYQYYVHKHDYEVAKDLKMPTKKERIDEFIKLYEDCPAQMLKDLVWVQKQLSPNSDANKKAVEVKLKKKGMTYEEYEAAYIVFNHAMEAAHRFTSTKKYAEIMASKYDAMVDDNNVNKYNSAHDPIIIFRASEALKPLTEVGVPQQPKDVMQKYREVNDEIRKQTGGKYGALL